MIAKGTEAVQILLRRGMRKHIQVHRGCHKHGRLHRKVGRNQHIVGNAIRHFANRRGRGGSDDHNVRPLSEVHVTVPRTVALRKEFANHGIWRECRECNRRDKLLTCGSDNYLNLGTCFHKEANELACLVSSNASGDAQNDMFSFHHSLQNFVRASALISCKFKTFLKNNGEWELKKRRFRGRHTQYLYNSENSPLISKPSVKKFVPLQVLWKTL